MSTSPTPPAAPRRPHQLVAHGQERVDDWYWLGDRDDPDVLDYLRAENEYADAVLAPTEALQHRLFDEIKGRVAETDVGPPTRHGPWWYWSRTVEGQQYRVMCRRPDPDRSLRAEDIVAEARAGGPPEQTGEQVLLDENQLAGESGYLAVGVFDISPDQRTLAYATDLDGSESYTLRFRDLETGTDAPDDDRGRVLRVGVGRGQPHVLLRPPRRGHAPVAGVAPPNRRARGRCPHLPGRRRAFLRRRGPDPFAALCDRPHRQQDDLGGVVPRRPRPGRFAAPSDPPPPARRRVRRGCTTGPLGWCAPTVPTPTGAAATNFALYRLAAAGGADPAAWQAVLPHRADVMLESAEAFAAVIVVGERSQADGLERIRILPETAPWPRTGWGSRTAWGKWWGNPSRCTAWPANPTRSSTPPATGSATPPWSPRARPSRSTW